MSILTTLFRPLLFVIAILVMTAITFQSDSVHAQTSGLENPTAGATPGGVNSGSSSDSELWRQIRKGTQGTVVGGDKSGGLMIQSGGQDYRLYRNGPLPRYTAWAILGTLILLSLFFALRGRIKIDAGPSGKTIKRFSLIERVGHWLLASSFIILALTGLNLIFGKSLLMPLVGKDIFASITEFGKYIHNYVGFAFMLGLLMIAVMWVVHNIPSMTDVKWLLRGGGIIGGGHPPAKKFNAGQKIIFWIVILCGISISLSGWALMNPFTTEMMSSTFGVVNSIFGSSYPTDLSPIQEQQYQSMWHAIMAAFMIAVILAHIYIGSVGMEGALDAMTTGEVDTNWAKEHHSLWVKEVYDGKRDDIKASYTASSASAVELTPAAPVTPVAASPKVQAKPVKLEVVPKPKVESTQARVRKRDADVKPAPVAKTRRKSKPKPKPVKKARSSTAKDDLKRIKGIGPQNEQRLNAMGIYKFSDIAAWSKREQADIGEKLAFPGRIEREEWVKQAKAFVRSIR